MKLRDEPEHVIFQQEACPGEEGRTVWYSALAFYGLVYVTREGVCLREYSWEVINAHWGILSPEPRAWEIVRGKQHKGWTLIKKIKMKIKFGLWTACVCAVCSGWRRCFLLTPFSGGVSPPRRGEGHGCCNGLVDRSWGKQEFRE